MRQETDGVLLESYLIYEPEHQATWFKEDQPLLGALDFDEKYQVCFSLNFIFISSVNDMLNDISYGYKSNHYFQPFLERRGDWTYCALAIRHLSQEDAGNYSVTVRNKHGEKSNHVRLSMKDPNAPQT